MKFNYIFLIFFISLTIIFIPQNSDIDKNKFERLYYKFKQLELINIDKPDCDKLRNQQLSCMACNIYNEARSEGPEGMLIVGKVTINRMISKKFPNTICGVVWQKRLNRPAQFSWTDDNRPDIVKEKDAWKKSVRYASLVIQELFDPNYEILIDNYSYNGDYMWYHTTSVKPSWAKRLSKATQIGQHIIYKEIKNEP